MTKFSRPKDWKQILNLTWPSRLRKSCAV